MCLLEGQAKPYSCGPLARRTPTPLAYLKSCRTLKKLEKKTEPASPCTCLQVHDHHARPGDPLCLEGPWLSLGEWMLLVLV